MISFQEAFNDVMSHPLILGDKTIPLLESPGRILAEDIKADRDFPPFHRSTKDGIAINFSAIEKGIDRFAIEGVLSAGMAQQTLSSDTNCYEIMTGAVLPKNADTIVMYEETVIENGFATLTETPQKGQNIHRQGDDAEVGAVLLEQGIPITAAVIGVLASVGKTHVSVKKNPKVCVISTGNELVEVSDTPLPHQIRKSNTESLTAALNKVGITPTRLHLIDDLKTIEKKLRTAMSEHDVLMLSGGVSKGKFDFIPDALEALGVKKVFHRVAQRPGKPFWFGVVGNRPTGNVVPNATEHNQESKKPQRRNEVPKDEEQKNEVRQVVFSFPGNPVSTFVSYHVYFLPWLAKSLGIQMEERTVILDEPVQPHYSLTLFLQVRTQWHQGQLRAKLIQGNGSGDLVSLAGADGFIQVSAGDSWISKGHEFEFISCS